MPVKRPIRLPALLAVVIGTAVLSIVFAQRVAIRENMDALRMNDPAMISTGHTNGINERVAIDIGLARADEGKLQAVAAWIQTRLAPSGWPASQGLVGMQPGATELTGQVIRNLPVLLTTGQLHRQVAPLLTDAHIRTALLEIRDSLAGRNEIDPADIRFADPLDLRRLVLARAAGLNGIPNTGPVISTDRRHALIMVAPQRTGIDGPAARERRRIYRELEDQVGATFGTGVTLTIAAADPSTPEALADVSKAIYRVGAWTAVGIGILVSIACSHPLVSMLCMLTTLAGTILAAVVVSFFHASVPVMVLGFGGVVLSITTGCGIAYLVLQTGGQGADRPTALRGARAAGLPALVTVLGALILLGINGPTIFAQVGWLTAVGIVLGLLGVRAVLPMMLTDRSPQRPFVRPRFSRWSDRLASGGTPGSIAALVAAAVLTAFVPSGLDADLHGPDGDGGQGRSARQRITDVWGDRFPGVYLVTAAADLQALQARNDRLQEQLDTEAHAGRIAKPTTPSLLFPGPERCAQNGAAWRAFWSQERIQAVSAAILREASALGFLPHTFSPFLVLLSAAPPLATDIPANLLPLLGITKETSGDWRQVVRIAPRERFDGPRLLARLEPLATVFGGDPPTQHSGRRLRAAALAMLLAFGVILVAVLIGFFADVGLLAAALLPVAFAFVCTTGTLGIMGRGLDVPALMIAVVVAGLGASCTVLLIRGYQRYQRLDHPSLVTIRAALFMAAGCWLAGFAALLAAQHDALKSVGWMACLGLGYSLAGTLLIVPPLLRRRFGGESNGRGGIAKRYRNLEPLVRMRVHRALRRDPLFKELADLAPPPNRLANILVVGCGYGVPACWMADRYPTAIVHGIDPDAERVRVTGLVLGQRGRVQLGWAPELPPMDVLQDLAILLDVSHCLQDWELEKTLERIHERLLPGGRLIMRSMLPAAARPRGSWYRDWLARTSRDRNAVYRHAHTLDALLSACGFEVLTCRTSGTRGHRVWHVARPN